ncbi:DUF6059 family protein [Micromonospora sp. NPDC050187]|uniref:DUF6059 family protein n=1 Tax=Micromonospora sp. NPDC050187 TaxID=3364277 RepID=UPI003787CBE4
MDAYRFLSRCRRLATEAARELFTQLATFGAALIGTPLPPEAFPPATPPVGGAGSPGGTVADPTATGRPTTGGTDLPTTDGPARPPSRVGPGALRAGAGPGGMPAGHPERLIPHVPPTPTERRLWSQLR